MTDPKHGDPEMTGPQQTAPSTTAPEPVEPETVERDAAVAELATPKPVESETDEKDAAAAELATPETSESGAGEASGDATGEEEAPGGEGSGQSPPTVEAQKLEAEDWRSTSRAVILFGLVAMAIPTWFRLSRGGDLAFELLSKNEMSLPLRDTFLLQILVSGGVVGFATLCAALFWTKHQELPQILERWAWFLSPLILLPAIPVMGCYSAWHQKHEVLLPIVLFLALLTEFFVSHALCNVPPAVRSGFPELSWKVGPATTGSWLRRHGWLTAAVCAGVFYAVFMSYFTVRWHNRLGTATFDLGINNNLIFGGLHGKFNQSTVIFPDEPQKYLANHVKLGLYFFLPLYALRPEGETLLILQSCSLGLGAIPLFLFARRRIPEWAALTLALAYLAYYPMHGANFYEMKLVPTAAAFVLTMIWALDAKHWVTSGVFFFMSLLMREDLPVPLAVIGGFLVLSGYRPRAGAIICGISVAWFVIVRFKIMTDAGAWWFPNMYEDLWAKPETGFRSVLKTLVSNPTFVLKHIFTEKKFWYLMHLLVPVAFLPVRRWYLWASLVPGAILTLLVTNYDPPVMFSFQYVMHWSPYLFVCAALALAAISDEPRGKARASGAIAAVAVASGALSFNYGAFPLRDRYLEAGYHKINFGWGPEEQEQLEQLKRLKQDIPREASVATTERIGAHLSSRVLFYTLRRGTNNADYVVARRSELRLGKTKQAVTDALESGEYGVAGHYGEHVLLKRGADTKENTELLREWRLVKRSRSRKSRAEELEEREESEALELNLTEGGGEDRELDEPPPPSTQRPLRPERPNLGLRSPSTREATPSPTPPPSTPEAKP